MKFSRAHFERLINAIIDSNLPVSEKKDLNELLTNLVNDCDLPKKRGRPTGSMMRRQTTAVMRARSFATLKIVHGFNSTTAAKKIANDWPGIDANRVFKDFKRHEGRLLELSDGSLSIGDATACIFLKLKEEVLDAMGSDKWKELNTLLISKGVTNPEKLIIDKIFNHEMVTIIFNYLVNRNMSLGDK